MLLTRRLRTSGSVAAIVATVVFVGLALALLLNRQYILDQVSVWQYTPSGSVAAFATRSGMSDKGIFYFYASHPALDNAKDFNDKCSRKEQGTAILGCYAGKMINVYNVSDQQLDGIREVTAAHEMLHAAYDRLSDGDKSTVNALLETEFTKLRADKDFAERMAFYDRTEPGERDNELHSVIGTEVASISPELEAHYKMYFTDRSKVVALHDKYAAVFTNLQARAKQLSDQLTRLGDSIEKNTASYNQQTTDLNNDIASFNTRAQSGGFSSNAEFQSERTALVSRVSQLDAFRQSINTDVERYNSLRAELMSIASQSDALNRSIDSTLAPAPSVK